jgi:Tol biopolymer transport system component
MSATIDRLKSALQDRYRVDREIGAGGMATVFLADDIKHNRKVAIKVLKEDLAASVGAARFLREIQIAAQLQHPNILPLLDSGDAGGLLYYVMPFVDGQSLRQRLAHERELPIGEAVRLLVEVVDALSHAHARGVVHRDIKPDNIMLSGRHALITDFGVARAVSEATGRNTVTSMGVALGTPSYMAPEQAVADPNVDHRADIYAVGVVAYELLAGRPPFNGVTPQQVLAAHVTATPDPLSQHRPGVSPALEAVIMRCLEKRPADRWQKCDDLLAALEPLATPSGGTNPTAARIEAVSGGGMKKGGWVVAAATFVLILAAVLMKSGGSSQLQLGRSDAVTTDAGLEIFPAISPDGKFIAYSAGNSAAMRVFVKPVGGGRPIPLSDDSSSIEVLPRWSPDGKQLLYLTNGGVDLAPAFGGGAGATHVVASNNRAPVITAAWSPEGKEFAYVRSDTLYRQVLDGSAPRVVAVSRDLSACDWSRNGKWIACASGNMPYATPGSSFGNLAPSAVIIIPAEGGAPIALTDSVAMNHSPVWADEGRRILFISDRDGPRDVYALSVGSDGSAQGTPTRLTTGLSAQMVSVTADGSRVSYAVLHLRSNIWSLPIPRGAPVTADGATQVTTGNQVIEAATVSPDGKWIVYDSNIGGNADLYRIPVGGGQPERLTNEPFAEFSGRISPDLTTLAYHSFRTPGLRQIEFKPVAGGPVTRLPASTDQQSNPVWSPDGTAVSFFSLTFPFVGYIARRDAGGVWGNTEKFCDCAIFGWSDAQHVVTGALALGPTGPMVRLAVRNVASGAQRTLWERPPGPEVPQGGEVSFDRRELYLKFFDGAGRASISALSLATGALRPLVRFTNPDKPSFRPGLSADASRLYFTIEDRQSDVFVAELGKR